MARPLALAVALSLLALVPAHVGAAGAPTAYNGQIPFECELQEAGMGTAFPHPDADPFCVEYDKTHQNVTDAGVVDFLSKEPARVAIAGPKCWYFQRDHWTGYVVQGDGTTQTYHWDGNYFYDKARGLGGAYIENFSINGQTGDPRTMPGFPDEWKPYFGPGGGGVQSSDSVRADPRCVAKAKAAPAPGPYKCTDRKGKVGRGMGPLRLGMTRKEAEDALGPPGRSTDGVERWCTDDGGKLQAGFAGGRLVFALTTSPAFDAGGVAPGSASKRVRKRYGKLSQRGGVGVFARRSRSSLLVIGADRKRVRFLAVAGPRASARSVDRWLDRTR